VADVSGAVQKTLWHVDGRNVDGALTQGTYGNGVTTVRSYDDVTGRLATINDGGIFARSYKYDPRGRVHVRSAAVDGRDETFEDDVLDRLTGWKLAVALNKGGGFDTTYEYDDLGNLTKVLVGGVVTESNVYGGNGKPHQLSSNGTGSFVYDA